MEDFRTFGPKREVQGGSENREESADAEMGMVTAGGPGEVESEQDLAATMAGIREISIEKVYLLAVHPLTQEPLSAFENSCLTVYEVWEWLTTLVRGASRIGIASRRRGVPEIEGEEVVGAGIEKTATDPVVELLAEVRALRALIAATVGVEAPGAGWVSGQTGGGALGGEAGGAAGSGVGVSF